MRECEKSLRSVHLRRALRLDLATGKSLEWHTCEGGAEGSRQLLHYRKKTSSLAKQLDRDSNLRLVQVTRMPCLVETDSSHSSYTLL